MEKGKKYADISKQFCIHPDILFAFRNYDGTGDTFKQVFAQRKALIEAGETYWNTGHDTEMFETALLNSLSPDFTFPTKRSDPTYEQQLSTFQEALALIQASSFNAILASIWGT